MIRESQGVWDLLCLSRCWPGSELFQHFTGLHFHPDQEADAGYEHSRDTALACQLWVQHQGLGFLALGGSALCALCHLSPWAGITGPVSDPDLSAGGIPGAGIASSGLCVPRILLLPATPQHTGELWVLWLLLTPCVLLERCLLMGHYFGEVPFSVDPEQDPAGCS